MRGAERDEKEKRDVRDMWDVVEGGAEGGDRGAA